jgi:hypothetical protein
MKTAIALIIGLFVFTQQEQMVLPKVQHRDEVQTTHYDIVTHTCPEGFEGHYVDPAQGFESYYSGRFGYGLSMSGGDIEVRGEEAFTVCFDKNFIEQLKKNPDMLTRKPLPARGV